MWEAGAGVSRQLPLRRPCAGGIPLFLAASCQPPYYPLALLEICFEWFSSAQKNLPSSNDSGDLPTWNPARPIQFVFRKLSALVDPRPAPREPVAMDGVGECAYL